MRGREKGMKGKAIVHAKGSDEWGTPQKLFDLLDRDVHFTLDVCATAANAKCGRYYTLAEDGLRQAWAPEVCFMNPPYSGVGEWVEKAIGEADKGATVVCLVAARTDTKWFWKLQARASAILFLKGRVRFEGEGEGEPAGAPFPSAVVLLEPERLEALEVGWWDWKGGKDG
jgi:site-specific DNA-methyltransferase (adenine-specific)